MILTEPSGKKQEGPPAVEVRDSSPDNTSVAPLEPSAAEARLAFDVGFFDPGTAAYLLVFRAGTPLNALQSRIVSIPPGEGTSPITAVLLGKQTSPDQNFVPAVKYQFQEDLRGKHLTFRFVHPLRDPS